MAEDNDNIRVPFGDGLSAKGRYENSPIPYKKDGFFISPDFSKMTDKEIEMYKLRQKIMGEGFYKELSPEALEKLKIQQQIREQQRKDMGLPEGLQLMNQGGRIGFSGGGDPRRRAFLKLLAALGGGIAGLKSGLFGIGGKETTKKAVTETVKSAGSGQPPPYFFRLVEKIKFMGDDTLASQDKARAYKYKDYVLEEDFAGNIEIIKKNMDEMYPEEVYIKYTADDTGIKNKKGFAKNEDYEEFTARPDRDGKMKDIEGGVPDEVIEEAGDTTAMTLKEKADGGRIGFRIGGSGKKFLEKIFGKEAMKEMPNRDPEMYTGMLEVVEMFRNRDKEGLKKYLQKFLPHMDDETIEAFIVGDAADAAGQGKYGLDNIQGQLIRLGSGRDYAGKIEAFNRLERNRALKDLEVTEDMKRKPNSSGGLQTMLGE